MENTLLSGRQSEGCPWPIKKSPTKAWSRLESYCTGNLKKENVILFLLPAFMLPLESVLQNDTELHWHFQKNVQAWNGSTWCWSGFRCFSRAWMSLVQMCSFHWNPGMCCWSCCTQCMDSLCAHQPSQQRCLQGAQLRKGFLQKWSNSMVE